MCSHKEIETLRYAQCAMHVDIRNVGRNRDRAPPELLILDVIQDKTPLSHCALTQRLTVLLCDASHRPRPHSATDSPPFCSSTDYLHTGSAVFFNGYLLHRSLHNTSNGYRRAFANHYMSAESKLPWTNDGRFDVTDDMRGKIESSSLPAF